MKFIPLLVGLQVYCICPSSFAFVAQNAPHRRLHHSTASSQLHAEKAVGATVDNPCQSGLALMLDDGTRKSHSMVQNTQFLTGFFKGLANRDSYWSLITSLYFVYLSMEEAGQHLWCTCENTGLSGIASAYTTYPMLNYKFYWVLYI